MPAFVACGLARWRELSQRERRMPQPQLRGLPQRLRQRLERTGGTEAARRVELRAGPPARSARGSRGRHSRGGSPLIASRRRRSAPRARGRRPRRRRRGGSPRSPPTPSHRRGVGLALFDLQPHVVHRGDAAQERRTGRRRRPNLQVRRPRAGERAAAQERAAKVGAAAAARPTTRPGGRSSGDASAPSTPACASVRASARAVDVELVARRAVERRATYTSGSRRRRASSARSGTRGARRPTRRDRGGTTRAPRPRRWTAPAVWKSAEISASRSHRRVGAIAASSARTSSASEPELRARRLRARAGGA